MIKKKYNIESNQNLINDIVNSLNIDRTIAELITLRGCNSVQDAVKFLYPNYNHLYNPFLFNGMQNAVNRINWAIQNKELIYIWGDFDVDGTLATSVLFLGLLTHGANVKYYIPDRHEEGYGLNKNGIDELARNGCKLLITVDCGITAKDDIEYAKQYGIDTIVTDHHNPPEEIPNCVAVIDAKIPNQNYPYKELCGAGVAGKLLQALFGMDIITKYIDLIAIATVADLVPLTDENRTIVSLGLKFMNTMQRPGVAALSKYAKGEFDQITAYHLGFRYGPMINACGRLKNANEVVALMTTADKAVTESIAYNLYQYNEERKQIENTILEDCLNRLKGTVNPKSIVLYDDNWDSGVIGIVASRIMEVYNCPVILLTLDHKTGLYHGSGRSISEINLYDTLTLCKSTITSFGGHSAAAGLNVAKENLELFSNAFAGLTSKYPDEVFVKNHYFDMLVKLNTINVNFIKKLGLLEPCGIGNTRPKFLIKNACMKKVIARGDNMQHFACNLYDNTSNCDAIAFNSKLPENIDDLDVIVSPSINVYKEVEKAQCIIDFFDNSEEAKLRELASQITQYGIRVMDQPLDVLGLAPKKIEQFHDAGIFTLNDLISYLPRAYKDFRYPKTVDQVLHKETCSMIGTIKKLKSGNKMAYAMCEDENGKTFMACWFHQDWVLRVLSSGYQYIFCGQVKKTNDGFVQIYPEFWDRDIDKYKTIVPIYKKVKNMSIEYLTDAIDKALKLIPNTDFLTKNIVDEFNMLSDYDATCKLHHPLNDLDIRDGERRKVFNSLWKFNFILKSKHSSEDNDTIFKFNSHNSWTQMLNSLPYSLTNDQMQCLKDMLQYISTGKRLNALVQGDVGCGKTIIAFFLLLLAMENGVQSCLIAPTEVLAKQHYEGIQKDLAQFNIKVGYLRGGMKVKEKRELLQGIADGSIQIVIGTHAVIQDSVSFKNLGLVVIDEQHRFGVEQREKLMNTENKPHLITMSATPIPRTTCMALYGDNIQVYSIKEKPAMRKEIQTMKMSDDISVNNFMLEEIRKGRQCYVVCPLIDASSAESMAEVQSTSEVGEALRQYFSVYPEVSIAVITGKMKKTDIATEIDKFVSGETKILVSTTIIEVGVNVPNSTVMVMKNSERFGLAQAHQLRGRVGRGEYQSYCILQAAPDDPKADILCSTNDGFEIAKQDLLLRGTGDFLGTDQTGNNKDVMLMIAEPELYQRISELNSRIYADPVMFAKYRYVLEEAELDKKN